VHVVLHTFVNISILENHGVADDVLPLGSGGGRLGGGGKVADEGGDGQDGEGMDGNGEGREGYYFKCIV